MPPVATLFRALIVIGFVAAILGSVIDLVIPGLVPTALEKAYETYVGEQDASLTFAVVVGALSLIGFALAVATTIGLLLFRRWARPLALWTTVVSVATYPALGPALYSGWALMLFESAMILWGAVLAMAYFSELKVRFEPSR